MNILFQSLSPFLRLSLSFSRASPFFALSLSLSFSLSSRYTGSVTPFTHYRSFVSSTRQHARRPLPHNTEGLPHPLGESSATPSSLFPLRPARVEGGAQSKRANLNTVDRAQKQWEHRRTTRDASKWSNNRGTCVPARAALSFELPRTTRGETAVAPVQTIVRGGSLIIAICRDSITADYESIPS